jgi:proline iminopeptidase
VSISRGGHTFNNDGLRLRCKVAGSGPVLIVQPPGWGIGAALYENTFAPLERNFTVIYHDPRGSGQSESPADPQEMNVGAFVEDLEALRKHLGETVTLIRSLETHSFACTWSRLTSPVLGPAH